MVIYFILIFFILFCPAIVKFIYKNSINKKKIITILSCGALYLVCALKGTSVGIDIAGYEIAYNQAGAYDWFDSSYIYFEKGYIFIEKFFNNLNFPFQLYMAIVYLVILVPLGIFIFKYSKNVTISFIIYICYQFFVFNISGVRQSIAMSICLIAYMVLEEKVFKNFLISILLIYIAFLFHSSAILYFFMILVKIFPLNKFFLIYSVLPLIFVTVFRNTIINYLNIYLGKYQVPENIMLGGNFILLLVILCMSLFMFFKFNNRNGNNIIFEECIKMLYLSVIIQLILNGSSALRAVNYYSIFVIILIPNLMNFFTKSSYLIYKGTIIIFMLFLFYIETLSINQFNCLPYLFFWQ